VPCRPLQASFDHHGAALRIGKRAHAVRVTALLHHLSQLASSVALQLSPSSRFLLDSIPRVLPGVPLPSSPHPRPVPSTPLLRSHAAVGGVRARQGPAGLHDSMRADSGPAHRPAACSKLRGLGLPGPWASQGNGGRTWVRRVLSGSACG